MNISRQKIMDAYFSSRTENYYIKDNYIEAGIEQSADFTFTYSYHDKYEFLSIGSYLLIRCRDSYYSIHKQEDPIEIEDEVMKLAINFVTRTLSNCALLDNIYESDRLITTNFIRHIFSRLAHNAINRVKSAGKN